ncbi:WRKY domain-containing protein [Tanacetum coccineum]
MEFSSWPESFSRNQIHEAFDQELIHYQQLSDTLSDLFCVSQNNEAELGTSYSGSNYASEVYANASSIMCNYNVNNISHVHKNTTCSSNSLDRLDDKKMVKTVKPVKKKRGCYTRKNLWTSSKITSWTDDGHAWRKYGQKEIQNAKHKRICKSVRYGISKDWIRRIGDFLAHGYAVSSLIDMAYWSSE